jgi:hypothetical protein
LEAPVVRFETSLVIPRPRDATFAFVTDLSNAVTWDPRTYQASKLTPGPVGLHTRFLLQGGLLSKQTVERFHVPELLRAQTELGYEVVSFVPRTEMVVRGETSALRYEDHLVFSDEGDATRLRYVATMELKGVLAIGDIVFKPIFEAIGADATRGIPDAVVAAVPSGAGGPGDRARVVGPTNPIVAPADVRRVVALDDQRVLRNLFITQGYHDVSTAILARTGGGDMNWCTLGSWASKTAGTFIRDDEVPSVFRKLLEGPPAASKLEALRDHTAIKPPHLIEIARAILHDTSTYIMVGNKVVFEELAQCCADFMHELGGDRSPDAAKLAAFQARYSEGDPLPDEVAWADTNHSALVVKARGGQAMLRGMVGHLYQAMFETDAKRRAEHILFANALGGLHEQTRLQPYIAGGLNSPISDTLVAWAHKHIDRDVPETGKSLLHRAVDAEIPKLGRMIERAWRDFSTNRLMTLTLPDGVLHLGHPIPADPGVPIIPAALETIADPELAKLLARYGALDVRIERTALDRIKHRLSRLFETPTTESDEEADVGAVDWTNFDQRMRFILTLFRARQQDPHLRQQPFSDTQRATLFDGILPPAPL